jgi:hypothetical protein
MPTLYSKEATRYIEKDTPTSEQAWAYAWYYGDGKALVVSYNPEDSPRLVVTTDESQEVVEAKLQQMIGEEGWYETDPK